MMGSVGLLVILVGSGFLWGLHAGGGSAANHGDYGGGWNPFGFVVFVAAIGAVATAVAYRRLSRPVADLLGAAERVAQGDYQVDVRPSGPRELRGLTRTFNDMAARLAASDELRRRFLADVTHELRTPLAVLQSGIEAQVDGIHPRDDPHLGSLLEETQILARLVDDLHTLALADAGRLALHREAVSLPALAQDAVASHAALAERRGIRLVVEVAGDPGELNLDPTRIRQVLANLLSNALRHTPAGGTVRVAVTTEAAGVAVTVTDSGPGIPVDRLARLFERGNGSADARGSGLGLSIAHDLVVAHGGSIRAWNEPPGGAAVSFTLPLAGQ